MQNITFHYKPNNFGSLILKHKSTGVTTASGYSARWVYGQPQKARYPFTRLRPVLLPPKYISKQFRVPCKDKIARKMLFAILCQALQMCNMHQELQHQIQVSYRCSCQYSLVMQQQYWAVPITTKPIIPVLFYFWEVLIVIGHMVICNSGMYYLILQFLFMCNLESLKQQVHL